MKTNIFKRIAISNYIGMLIKVKSLINPDRCHYYNDTKNCQLPSLYCLCSSHSIPSFITFNYIQDTSLKFSVMVLFA